MRDTTAHSRVHLGFFLTLVLLLTSIYLATYSGRIQTSDSLRLFDAASSLVRYGTTERDESLRVEMPQHPFDFSQDYPLLRYEFSEPLVAWTAAGWYALADVVPQVGLVHVTWLMNIVFVALGSGLFYIYARQWGYEQRIALAGALLLGIGTIVWAYSKTLFREPLVIVGLLSSAICLEQWWQMNSVRRWGWLVAAIAAFGIAYYAKNSAAMALPALIVLALPQMRLRSSWHSLLDALLLAGIALVIALAFVPGLFEWVGAVLPTTLTRYRLLTEYARPALHTYLFSVGGSIWGTSPVLLLALPGLLLWWRDSQRRRVWALLLMLFGYAVGHALFTGEHWFGGLSLPPRFLLPVIPFMMLAVLPVLAWLWQQGRALGWRVAAGVLIVFSVGVQLIAVVSYADAYVFLLPPESNNLVEWLPGVNQLRYARWLLLPQSWDSLGYDIAWLRTDAPLFIVAWLLTAAYAGWLLLRQLREKRLGWRWLPCLLLPILLYGSLRWLHDNDRLYKAHRAELHQVLDVLATEAEDNQPLLLTGGADVTYEHFVMNYWRSSVARPLVLPFPPGEAVSPREPPQITSPYPAALLDVFTPRIIDFLAHQHERLWLLTHNSVFYDWSVRPLEWYLSVYHYPLQVITTDAPDVRLWEFSTVAAPDPYTFTLPQYTSTLRYDDAIQLRGFSLPQGTTYAAGDVLPLSLLWQSETPLTQNYTVAWFVAPEGGTPVADGMNSMPQNNFAPTTIWQPNSPVWDNRALVLPDNLAAGEYKLWVLLYESTSGGAARLPVTTGDAIDETIGVLPVTIRVD